jgi:acetyl esterase/lipase
MTRRFPPPWSIIRLAGTTMYFPHFVGDARSRAAPARTACATLTSRIVVAGASAGGYLTLVTGYRVRPKPKALVALYGFGDLIGDWSSKPNPYPRYNLRKISREEAESQTDGTVISDSDERKGNGGSIYMYYRQNGLWPEEVSGFARSTIARLGSR